MKNSKNQSPKYYIYVSDSKLEMLFDQIDSYTKRRVSAQVTVDLKLASLSLNRADNPEPSRMAKLAIVEQYLRSNKPIGTTERPGMEYFQGEVAMEWNTIEHWSTHEKIVLFRSFDEDMSTCIVLAGSPWHLLGRRRGEEGETHSELPQIVKFLDPYSDLGLEPQYGWADQAVRLGAYFRSIPSQRLEFLAVVLAQADAEVETGYRKPKKRVHVILGSPLYVAIAERSLSAVPS